jgi:hypothetical protein
MHPLAKARSLSAALRAAGSSRSLQPVVCTTTRAPEACARIRNFKRSCVEPIRYQDEALGLAEQTVYSTLSVTVADSLALPLFAITVAVYVCAVP